MDRSNRSKNPRPPEEPRVPGRFILPSLVSSRIASKSPAILAGLLLLDIGRTFNLSVGITGQITTVAWLATAISSLFIGVASVRFTAKSLLLTGLVFFSISAVGCFLAGNFTMLLIFYTLSGIGLAMVSPMSYALVADYFPLQQRVRAIGWVLTGSSLAAVIGAPVIGVIVGMQGWRIAFLGFDLPIALLSLVLVAKKVPPPARTPQTPMHKVEYLEGFKEIFSNKSAMACLGGMALAPAALQAISLYSVSFVRERFLVSIEFGSLLVVGTAFCSVLGNQTSGRVVNQLGARPVTVLAGFLAGIFIISYTNLNHLWVVVAFACLGSMFSGMMFTAALSLALEQVPKFYGSMMSLTTAAAYLGMAVGAGVGGVMLLWFDYEKVGLVLGAMSIISALLFYIVAHDPTSTKSNQ